VTPARIRNRRSAVRVVVLPATASLARKLRLPAEKSSSDRGADRATGQPFPQGIPRRTKEARSGLTSSGRRLLGKTSAPRSEVETSSVLDSGTFRASRYLPDVSGGLRVDYDSVLSAFSVPKTTKTGIAGLVVRANDDTLDPDRTHRLAAVSLSLGCAATRHPPSAGGVRTAGRTGLEVFPRMPGCREIPLRGATEVVHGPLPPELLRFRPALVRSWERIARIRALGSQPPPPAPGWRAEVRTSHPRNPARHIATACITHIFSAPLPGGRPELSPRSGGPGPSTRGWHRRGRPLRCRGSTSS